MADVSSFINDFLRGYKSYKDMKFTVVEAGEKAKEERLQEKAREAVEQQGFLFWTLFTKMDELGLGDRGREQLAETAKGLLLGPLKDFNDWLEQFDRIFDENAFAEDFNWMARQMYDTRNDLEKDVVDRYGYLGTKVMELA